jgi:hypothetical protein
MAVWHIDVAPHGSRERTIDKQKSEESVQTKQVEKQETRHLDPGINAAGKKEEQLG